jgi:hypothetical protein
MMRVRTRSCTQEQGYCIMRMQHHAGIHDARQDPILHPRTGLLHHAHATAPKMPPPPFVWEGQGLWFWAVKDNLSNMSQILIAEIVYHIPLELFF